MQAGTDAEIEGRLGNLQLAEKNVRHVFVVMLPGVDEQLFEPGPLAKEAGEHGGLDELGASADDRDDFHVEVPIGACRRVPDAGSRGAARLGKWRREAKAHLSVSNALRPESYPNRESAQPQPPVSRRCAMERRDAVARTRGERGRGGCSCWLAGHSLYFAGSSGSGPMPGLRGRQARRAAQDMQHPRRELSMQQPSRRRDKNRTGTNFGKSNGTQSAAAFRSGRGGSHAAGQCPAGEAAKPHGCHRHRRPRLRRPAVRRREGEGRLQSPGHRAEHRPGRARQPRG